MKHKVLFTENYLTAEGKSFLEANGCEVIDQYLRWEPEEKLIAALKGMDAVIAGGEPYNERVIKSAHGLKVIARLGAGTDAVDLDTAARSGIIVTNTPGATSPAVAELTIGLMLSLLRNIPGFCSEMKKGIWSQKPVGKELSDCTVGIVGTGFIGRETIRLLKSFGTRIVAFDVFQNRDFAGQYGFKYVGIEDLMQDSDIVSIHVPLNAETTGFINPHLLNRMKPTAYLINTSRGQVIDKIALKHVLENKRIAGAALDAHWQEPCSPGDPIVQLDNVITTPHIGYNTRDAQARMVKMAVEEVAAVLNGGVPRYQVNAPHTK